MGKREEAISYVEKSLASLGISGGEVQCEEGYTWINVALRGVISQEQHMALIEMCGTCAWVLDPFKVKVNFFGIVRTQSLNMDLVAERFVRAGIKLLESSVDEATQRVDLTVERFNFPELYHEQDHALDEAIAYVAPMKLFVNGNQIPVEAVI